MKISKKYYDEVFEFAGLWEQPSACGLKIVDKDDQKIVIVTELYQDNPGTSVTQSGASLAEQICKRKNLSMSDIVYIECKPDTNSKLSFYDEDYFEVTFTEINMKPKFRKLSANEIKDLILQPQYCHEN